MSNVSITVISADRHERVRQFLKGPLGLPGTVRDVRRTRHQSALQANRVIVLLEVLAKGARVEVPREQVEMA